MPESEITITATVSVKKWISTSSTSQLELFQQAITVELIKREEVFQAHEQHAKKYHEMGMLDPFHEIGTDWQLSVTAADIGKQDAYVDVNGETCLNSKEPDKPKKTLVMETLMGQTLTPEEHAIVTQVVESPDADDLLNQLAKKNQQIEAGWQKKAQAEGMMK